MYIETDRLILKPFEERDKSLAINMFVNDQIKQTYMLPDFPSEEAAAKLFYRLQELSLTEGRFVVGVYRKTEDGPVLIGFMNDVEIKDGKIEMGYVIDPTYHNQGYCTEALKGMIQYLLEHGFSRVITGAFEGNAASLRVMEKSGMQKIDYTDEITYRGKVHRCIYYVMDKEQNK